MGALFVLIFIAAACVQVWARLTDQTQTAIIAKAKAMFNGARQVFNAARDKLFRKRTAWRHCFLGDKGELTVAGRIALADFTKFCRGMASLAQVSPATKQVDPIATGIAIGRHEAWLYIMQHLNLDPSTAIAAMKDEDPLAA